MSELPHVAIDFLWLKAENEKAKSKKEPVVFPSGAILSNIVDFIDFFPARGNQLTI